MPRGTSILDQARLASRLWVPPGGGSKGLWIEKGRSYQTDFDSSNILTQSQTLDHSDWTKNAISVTANAVTAPDGTVTGDLIVESATTADHNIAWLFFGYTTINYAFTVYAKYHSRPFLIMCVNRDQTHAIFDIQNGRCGSKGTFVRATYIQDVGGGWFRCTSCLTGDSAIAVWIEMHLATSDVADRVQSYAGNGTSGMYLFGANYHAGDDPLLYRATTTAAVSGSEPTWRQDAAAGALSWLSDKPGLGLSATHKFRNRPPLIGD